MPLVTMEDESISDLFIDNCVSKGLQDQIDCIRLLHGKTNNKTVEKVFDHRQISPTLFRRNKANISRPFLIGSNSMEVPMQEIAVNVAVVLAGLTIWFSSSSHHRVNPHHVHQAQDSFVINLDPFFLPQPCPNPAVPVGAS